MRKKGFTLVELLVVIAIIALLMGILMPALSRVRMNAYQLVCGTNLKGIGNGILMYSNTFDEQYPRAGGTDTIWSNSLPGGFGAVNPRIAYGTASGDGAATITSCFYLLIKYGDLTPKVFLCKAESDVTEYQPEEGRDVTELYDFGSRPQEHCSYAYHNPFTNYRLRSGGESTMAVAADRNPFIESTLQVPKDFDLFNPAGNKEEISYGNSGAHQDEGQNVLFMDNSVSFEKTSACGTNGDNIYTIWGSTNPNDEQLKRGSPPVVYSSAPRGRSDSLLVNDGTGTGGGTGPKVGRCFLANTPVWTSNGFVEIANVTAGQVVGKGVSVEMLQIHEEKTSLCYDITLSSGECISVVDDHLFMIGSGLWVSAPNLRSGMTLKTQNGSVKISDITSREFTGKVYNLKVKDSERYMVGKDMVIVRDW